MMTRCAELLDSTISADFIDINVGCPIDLVVNKGAGSALLQNARRLEDICMGMSSVMERPLTIKVRMGWEDKIPTVHKIIPKVFSTGSPSDSLRSLRAGESVRSR